MSEDFRVVASRRISESRALLQAAQWSGAYYLAGYSIECAIKATILKEVKKFHMPDKKMILDSHVHDLSTLMTLAGLGAAHSQRMGTDPIFARNWTVVKDWNEQSRYETWSENDARDLFDAVTARRAGVFNWVKRSW